MENRSRGSYPRTRAATIARFWGAAWPLPFLGIALTHPQHAASESVIDRERTRKWRAGHGRGSRARDGGGIAECGAQRLEDVGREIVHEGPVAQEGASQPVGLSGQESGTSGWEEPLVPPDGGADTHRYARIATVIAAGALTLAGCSDDSPTGPAPSGPGPGPAAGDSVAPGVPPQQLVERRHFDGAGRSPVGHPDRLDQRPHPGESHRDPHRASRFRPAALRHSVRRRRSRPGAPDGGVFAVRKPERRRRPRPAARLPDSGGGRAPSPTTSKAVFPVAARAAIVT